MKGVSTVIGWICANSRGFRSRMLLSGLAGVLQIVCGLAFIWVSKLAIDSATGHATCPLWQTGGLLALFMAGNLTLSAFQIWIKDVSTVEVQNRLHGECMRQLLHERWNGRERLHTGDVLNRLEQDVKDLVTLYVDSVPSVFVMSIQFLASFVFLLYLDSKLAFVLLAIMPFFILVSKLYFFRMRSLNKETRSSDSFIQSLMQETMQHRMVAKALCMEHSVLERLRHSQSDLLSQTKRKTGFSIFSRVMVMVGFATGYIVTFLWGAWQLQAGLISFGVMTAFLQLVGQIQRPVFEMARMVPTVITAFTASERLMELQDAPQEAEAVGHRPQGQLGVRLENIWFGYEDGNRYIYNGYSYDFKPGSFTAIIGETGSGKTTMTRLLLALLQPEAGSVRLYGSDGEVVASAQARCNFSYMPQGNTLFSGTVRDNLRMGNPVATDAEMLEALHVAVADFVLELPLGLDAPCGEMGGGFSEGQAQRIAIARSLLGKGAIYLLDEATSALDEETERLFLVRFMQYRKGKTVLFVTHRKAVCNLCDEVIRL